LEVEDAYLDWTVRCPHCGHEFVPNDLRAAATRSDDRPRRSRAGDDRDSEREDERDHDRYHDRDSEFDERDRVPAEVRAEALLVVAAPATWLEICGWLTALAALGGGFLCIVLGLELAKNPPNANQNDEIFFWLVIGCGASLFGVPYGVAMAIGGRKMRNLSSHGWATAGGILGVAAFTLFSCWGIIQTGIGAWALVTLDKPVVREAFGLPPRGGYRRRRRKREYDD
jgi:hypothetical protein